jgi:hypothetical protein
MYGIRMILRCGEEKLTDRQRARLERASPPTSVTTRSTSPGSAPSCSARPTGPPTSPRAGGSRRRSSPPSRPAPIPEIKRLGTTLKQWRAAFLAYFDTARSSNGAGTEAINGLIELHRRIARGFRNRDNYRLRMLLIGGGLTHPT